jgi:hypothetical protein
MQTQTSMPLVERPTVKLPTNMPPLPKGMPALPKMAPQSTNANPVSSVSLVDTKSEPKPIPITTPSDNGTSSRVLSETLTKLAEQTDLTKVITEKQANHNDHSS